MPWPTMLCYSNEIKLSNKEYKIILLETNGEEYVHIT